MEVIEENRIFYYKSLAKDKNYRQETIEMGWMLACTKDAVTKYGSIKAAFEEVIKLCEKNDSGEKFIAEVSALIGEYNNGLLGKKRSNGKRN